MPFAAIGLALAAFVAVFFGLPRPAGGATPSGPPLAPRPSSSPMYARAAVVAERLKRLWTEATGDPGPPSPAALEILLSQAALESGIAEPGVNGVEHEPYCGIVCQNDLAYCRACTVDGTEIDVHGIEAPAAYRLLDLERPEPLDDTDDTGWTGAMRGSGNLGARQCDQSEQNGPAKEPFYTCELAEDSKPNSDGTSTKFAVRFRYYHDAPGPDGTTRPAGDWAAYDFLRSIARQRPKSFAALRTGSVQDYAAALYAEHYYGGFGATPEARIAGYVKAIRSHLPAVAAALGHDRVFAS